MASASNYLENKLLDHSLGVASYTMPSTLYVALFKNTSGNAATNLESNIITDEISGNGYTRKLVTFAAASGGSISNNIDVIFNVAAGLWGDISHVAIMDNPTGGNVLYWGPPNIVKNIDTGDIYQIASTKLTATMD